MYLLEKCQKTVEKGRHFLSRTGGEVKVGRRLFIFSEPDTTKM